MLCEAGADVNVQDLVGRSPVWLAVAKDGHVSHLRELLRTRMCELDCADLREKRTALQVGRSTVVIIVVLAASQLPLHLRRHKVVLCQCANSQEQFACHRVATSLIMLCIVSNSD